MPNYEEQMRREMEAAAAEQQLQPQCPVEDEVDAAFGFRELKKQVKSGVGKGMNRDIAIKRSGSVPKRHSSYGGRYIKETGYKAERKKRK